MGFPAAGMAAEMKTATATLSEYLSMAGARLCPPKLWPTRTAFSPGGRAATASSSGRLYSSNERTSSMHAALAPHAAMSSAVTRWPADSRMVATMYQHHAPWHTP
jgi:hypothetical protein